jgi:hypothetical protein
VLNPHVAPPDERQARTGPGRGHETARLRQCDVGRTEVRTTKADVGGDGIGHRDVLYAGTIGRDDGNPAVVQGGDAHMPRTVDRQGVELLIAGEADKEVAAVRGSGAFDAHLARCGDFPPPYPSGNGLRHIEARPIR